MPYSFRELAPSEPYDPHLLYVGTPFTQQSFYGAWQHNLKREVKRYVVLKDTQVIAYFQLIVYPLIKGKQYIYIPYGPVCADVSPECIHALKDELMNIARKNNAVFVRLDFTPLVPVEILKNNFTSAPQSTYHSAYFQPRYEWFLSLTDSEDEILKKMHEKTRYSVRLAERKGIECTIITSDFGTYFDTFYELMSGTAQRNGFTLHEKAYYQAIFTDLSSIKDSYVSVASFENNILAIDLVIVSGGIATYVFGGSSNEERNRQPTYLAQWRAIQHAKSLGCTAYNFGGIAPEDNANLYKGWEGLTSFKKKFGGYEVKHSDFYDVVVQPFWYYMYVARKLVKKYTPL